MPPNAQVRSPSAWRSRSPPASPRAVAAASPRAPTRRPRPPRPRPRWRRSAATRRCPRPRPNFKPVKADTLSVVTSLPGPGFWEGSDSDPTKVTSGYEYDIAKCMQSTFGLTELNVRNVSFDAIVAGTVTNYDVALSQVSITSDRAKVVVVLRAVLRVEAGRAHARSDKSIAHARRGQEATKWGVQTATTAIDLLEEHRRRQPALVPATSPTRTPRSKPSRSTPSSSTPRSTSVKRPARTGKFHVVAQFNQPGGPDQYGAILPKGSANVAPVNAVFKSNERLGRAEGAHRQGPDRRPRHAHDHPDHHGARHRDSDGDASRLRTHRPAADAGRCRASSPASPAPSSARSPRSRSTLVTWAGLRAFDQSLTIGAPGPQIALGIEIALGHRGARRSGVRRAARSPRSFRARRLADEGRIARRPHRGRRRPRRSALRDRARPRRRGRRVRRVLPRRQQTGASAPCCSTGISIWSSRTALLRGFWWNIKLFVVAEVLVLVWALVVAVVRQLPGPGVRARSASSRSSTPTCSAACPTIIVIYLIGFGFPLAGVEPFATHMSGEHPALLARRRSRSCSCTARTSPRCTAPASRASTGARPRRRARSGSRSGRRCATS